LLLILLRLDDKNRISGNPMFLIRLDIANATAEMRGERRGAFRILPLSVFYFAPTEQNHMQRKLPVSAFKSSEKK
jgi:hypothetical protein